MVDQTVSQDSKLGQLYLDIWRTNKEEHKQSLEHRLLLLIVRGNNHSFYKLQYPHHPSQSNNLTQSSNSIFSSSNLSHTASPPSQFLVKVTIDALTVQPVGFNVVK